MPIQSMQSIAEHSLFKAALPIICAALIGSITWIFVTVMDLDKVLHRVEQSEIPQINKDIADGYKKLEELEKLMTDDKVYDAMAGDIYGQGKVLALNKYKFLKWSYTSFLWGMSGAIVVFLIQNIV